VSSGSESDVDSTLASAAFAGDVPPEARDLTTAGNLFIACAAAGSRAARDPRSSMTPSSDWICVVSSPVAARKLAFSICSIAFAVRS
jgi:hypothetical protein